MSLYCDTDGLIATDTRGLKLLTGHEWAPTQFHDFTHGRDISVKLAVVCQKHALPCTP